VSDRVTQISSGQVLSDSFKGKEIESFIFLNWPTDGAAKLFTMKIRQRLAIRSVSGKTFKALEVKSASVDGVGARLRDHVDNAAGSSTKFGICSSRYNLKFLNCLERDVDCCSLTSKLLAKKAVVVVSAVETHVIKNAALSRESYFVAVWSLDHAYTRCER